jgi:hypothetical protein
MSNGSRRPRLVGAGALLVLCAVALTTLYLLFPGQQRFALQGEGHKPDSVSIAYLQAMLRSAPTDTALRLELVRQLIETGQWHAAMNVLDGLESEDERLLKRVALLRLRIRAEQITQMSPDDVRRAGLIVRLAAQLQELAAQPHTQATLEWLYRLALDVDDPDLAARFAVRLARLQPKRAGHWWAEAGRWHMAAGEQLAAADAYMHASEHGGGALAALRALFAARQAGDKGAVRALQLAREARRRYSYDRAVQEEAIKLARSLNRNDLALRWNTALLATDPNDMDMLQRQRDIALATDDLGAALAAARHLVRVDGSSTRNREALARIEEWSGHIPQAEAQWRWLASHRAGRLPDLELARLARMNYDYPTLAEALSRLQRRGGLDAAQRDELVIVYQTLGEPEKAHEVLARYIGRHPGDRAIRVKMADLQVYDGEPAAAIASWKAIGRRFGENVEVRLALMRLNWQTYHMDRALQLARSAAPEFAKASDYDLSIAGELAWRGGDDALLKAAYDELWLRKSAAPIVSQRMALAAMQAGDVKTAVLWAQRGWQRYRDALLLLRIMPVAANAQRWDLVRRMVAAAGTGLDGHLEYWLIRAELTAHDGHLRRSAAAYRRALAVAPGSVTARAGMLWTLIALNDRVQLRGYLRRWEPDALADSGLWAVFAVAYSQLGETRRALVFYAREMHFKPHDYLWAASYAQALEQAGYATAAWRMRRYALRGLRLQAKKELADGYAGEATGNVVDLSRRLLGAPAGAAWLGAALPLQSRSEAAAALVSWYLAEDRPQAARFWLLRRMPGSPPLPAWQRLAVAIANRDLPKIAALLRDDDLSTADRVLAERTLGRHAQALADALGGIGRGSATDNVGLRKAAAELSAELPNDTALSVGGQRLGGLDLVGTDLHAALSRGSWTLNTTLAAQRLFADASLIDLAGANLERRGTLGLAYRGLRERWRGHLGLDSLGAHDLLQWGLGYDYTLSQRLGVSLDYVRNGLSEDSAALRAGGARDSLTLSVDAALTSRLFANLSLARDRYHSRAGAVLGNGYSANWTLGQRYWLGTNRLGLSLSGSLLHNHLAAMLPQDLAERLPAGSGVGNVLPTEYRSVGLGVDLARGTPSARYPDAASPRYALGVWGGWVWPDRKPAWRAQASLGTRVLGSDDLRLSASYGNAAGQVANRSNTLVTLSYRWFFGR